MGPLRLGLLRWVLGLLMVVYWGLCLLIMLQEKNLSYILKWGLVLKTLSHPLSEAIQAIEPTNTCFLLDNVVPNPIS